jgi:hypothetical protein
VTAHFSQGPPPYTLTVNIDGQGTVARDPDQAVYASGSSVELTAMPAAGWYFAGWSGDLGGYANPANVTMDSNKTVTATFLMSVIPQPAESSSWDGPPDMFTIDFDGKITKEPISSDGRLLNTLEAPSPDGAHLFEMESGTKALDEVGNWICLIVIRKIESLPLPDNTVLVGNAYDFNPSGTNFTEPVRLTLAYDVNELPQNVTSVALAYYNSDTGWTELQPDNDVVAGVGQLSAPVRHFTTFAVLAKVSPPQPVVLPLPPATFELSNLSITPLISQIWESLTFRGESGKAVTITVDVTNQGGQRGSFNAVLSLNGITRALVKAKR